MRMISRLNVTDEDTGSSEYAGWSPIPTADEQTASAMTRRTLSLDVPLEWRASIMRRTIGSALLASLAFAGAAQPAAAQLGARPADAWIKRLERPERLAELKREEVIAKLGLKPGDIVADIGAGAGVFSWPLARAVAPGGLVYAVEVDPGFTAYLERRAREQKIDNVRPVLGRFEDPMLPDQIDLAFFHDVLHHIEKRAAYLKTLARYLKPGGRVAVIELDSTRPDSPHRDDPKQQVTKEELREWMAAAGLQPVEDIPLFDDKWFVIYVKKSS